MPETATSNTTEATETAAETSGGSTEAQAPATEATETPTTPPEGEAALGDAGKKALDAMKAKWKEAEAKAKTEAEARAALEAKIAGTEAEHAAAKEAQRVRDEALAAANKRILSAEVRAQAAGKLQDPTDALAYIDLSSFEVGDDGAVDVSAITAAIDNLITTKPYLAAQGGRFQGGADSGARKEAAGPAQLTRADMARMTPEQIVEAQEKGQFNDLLSGK